MYATKRNNSKALMAVLAVALLAVCAFVPVVDADTPNNTATDSDGNSGETYGIVLFTNESFSYDPKVNLTSGTTVFSLGSDSTRFTLTDNSSTDYTANLASSNLTRTSSGSTKAAESVVINAKWTSGDSTTITQNVKQTINFYVYDQILIDSKKTSTTEFSIPTTSDKGDKIVGFTTSSDAAANTAFTASMTYTSSGGASTTTENIISTTTGAFYVTVSTNGVNVYAGQTNIPEGTYAITITGNETGSPGDETDAISRTCVATKTVNITVADGLKFTDTTSSYYTYVNNQTPTTIDVSTNVGTASATTGDATITFESVQIDNGTAASGTEAATAAKMTLSGSAITFNPKSYSVSDQYDEIKVKVKATASLVNPTENNATTSATKEFTIKVYAALVFTTTPTISDKSAVSATGNPLDMLLTTNIEGANTITYNWGDGKTTSVDVSDSKGTSFAARHVYNTSGSYLITVTAANDVDSSTTVILYNADDGLTPSTTDEPKTDDKKDSGFLAEHGWLFIVFAIIAVLLAVAYVYFGFQTPYVLVLLVLFAVLAVLLFVYKDFGGIADAVSGLLKKD